jgi:hypothetical protein
VSRCCAFCLITLWVRSAVRTLAQVSIQGLNAGCQQPAMHYLDPLTGKGNKPPPVCSSGKAGVGGSVWLAGFGRTACVWPAVWYLAVCCSIQAGFSSLTAMSNIDDYQARNSLLMCCLCRSCCCCSHEPCGAGGGLARCSRCVPSGVHTGKRSDVLCVADASRWVVQRLRSVLDCQSSWCAVCTDVRVL